MEHLGDAPLDGDVEVGNVVKDKVGQLLVLFFAEMVDERLRGKLFAELVGSEAVLSKGIVEHVHHC